MTNLWYTGLKPAIASLSKEVNMSEEFRLGNWISEGVQGVRSKARLPKSGLVPEGFREHIRASRKEFLLAFRSLFDAAIDNLDKPKASSRKATKIKVE
jgi:hypothetical protein